MIDQKRGCPLVETTGIAAIQRRLVQARGERE
jgi:hypothetical protein